nr:reverse transcriptase [Tanacetum cinerariifolium]
GYSGSTATTNMISEICYWKKIRQDVKTFVALCAVCQISKPNLVAYPGLLHPLPVPDLIWTEISMDFIEGLPLSNGKSVNLVVVDRLREKPKEWSKWLSLPEYWYNTNFHTFIQTTLYGAVHGQPPPSPIAYIEGQSLVDKVARSLNAREAMVQLLKFHLQRAQQKMKVHADKSRTDRIFKVGQYVYLKLQPHRQVTMRQGKYNKLTPKYYGPFQILDKAGHVAYKLLLPSTSQIHLVFHVSRLKLYKGPLPNAAATLPVCDAQGELLQLPMNVLDRLLGKVGNSAAVYVLIQWSNGSEADAT